MDSRSGIPALDERLGGLRQGGLYLIAGAPGSGRLVALMQFLRAGLEEGPVGLVTAAPLARIFEESKSWGFGLEDAWRSGQLRLLTLAEDFDRRLTSAPDPEEAYEELGRLLGAGVRRLAIYPGSPLWDARSGTSFANRFLKWLESHGATTFAAIGARLEDGVSPATDWMLQSATGILLIEARQDGLREITVQRPAPAGHDAGPITLELAAGKGLVVASDKPTRRAGDGAKQTSRNVLLLNIAERLPPEVGSWARQRYPVEETNDVFRSVEMVQDDPARFGLVLIYVSRDQVDAALRACRSLRRLASVPVFLVTEDAVRGTDRVRGLEAGASDFMSGPLSLVELASRVEHALIAGARPLALGPAQAASASDQHPAFLDAAPFAQEVRARLGRPEHAHFTFLVIRSPQARGANESLGAAVTQTIRGEEGDLVGGMPGGLGVLLQGTSMSQAPAFLQRVKAKLGKDFPDFEWKARAGSTDAEIILSELAGPAQLGSAKLSRTGT